MIFLNTYLGYFFKSSKSPENITRRNTGSSQSRTCQAPFEEKAPGRSFWGRLYVLRKLHALYILQRRRRPDLAAIFKADRNLMRRLKEDTRRTKAPAK